MVKFEERQHAERVLAKKLWDIPFVATNLYKLTKKELLILIDAMICKIGVNYESSWFELDIKDLLFEEKCWLIETLDPEFFEKV